jgi:hypothetical protein
VGQGSLKPPPPGSRPVVVLLVVDRLGLCRQSLEANPPWCLAILAIPLGRLDGVADHFPRLDMDEVGWYLQDPKGWKLALQDGENNGPCRKRKA